MKNRRGASTTRSAAIQGLVLATFLGLCGCQPTGTPTADSNAKVAAKVEETRANVDVSIDFQGRADNLQFKVALTDEKTVLEALLKACDGKVVFTGQGETAFVKSIMGVENEGAGGDNWTYRVNGELGNTSSGSFMLQDDDQLQWTLGKYSPPDSEK